MILELVGLVEAIELTSCVDKVNLPLEILHALYDRFNDKIKVYLLLL